MEFIEPTETDDISCHLQQIGMGSLTCRAAKQTGDKTTNETNPEICFNCPTGKIYRNVGCEAATPKLRLYGGGQHVNFENIFCTLRKRSTTYEYCQTCNLAQAETTRQITSTARGIFQSNGFYSAYKDIEKSRVALRDGNFENSITRSVSCLESVIKVMHEKLEEDLPSKQQLTDLWKSATTLLINKGCVDPENTKPLTNSLSGAIMHLAGIRNSLSDSHGRNNSANATSESIAELALNISSTLSTYLIRNFTKIKETSNE